jgi:hypothetical protein
MLFVQSFVCSSTNPTCCKESQNVPLGKFIFILCALNTSLHKITYVVPFSAKILGTKINYKAWTKEGWSDERMRTTA